MLLGVQHVISYNKNYTPMNIDYVVKRDKPPMAVCLLIDLSATLPLNI